MSSCSGMSGNLFASTERRPLNPMWVEWLMGFPVGWGGSDPWETLKFPEWQQQHSES